ncbi:catechol 2,3-dioxygenase-like lactoylglutathione lyase family enzyme [Nonomuraea thailandensis]|uniref:Catechol 2,3-dioxygenase-like lactoylglutathione lyase family enzyme n=1 Tax=Nonomuraea thailandensis TaxID=1188745 RepID=A0A9X2K535_9ACTN|nr:VOC family protein [Nonomuraea thailandensis]MCP2360084.1 catechol 2,3-dioxygenase-like lactoylglutathione lyase family enzyme [Nonomuraea thailandensis]
MGDDVNGLHHVGHIVRDLDQAMERYRRLGFTVPAPACPVLPRVAGGPAEPFGVANTHVYFPGNFVELVAVLPETGPAPGAVRPIPLRVPGDRLPGLVAAIRATAGNIASFLRRFEGLHIMIADTPDLDRVAARLTAAGVRHGGVHTVQRPVETSAGTRMEPARYLEISDPGLPEGRVPEGRIGFAENTAAGPHDDPPRTGHPNGATGLVECVLCAPDAATPELRRRYGAYFGRPRDGWAHEDRARDGRARDGRAHDGRAHDGRAPGAARFERAGVTVVPASELAELLPGERPAALPAFVAYAVSVGDLAATERFLRRNDVPITRTGPGELFVPADAALGVAIIFRQEG